MRTSSSIGISKNVRKKPSKHDDTTDSICFFKKIASKDGNERLLYTFVTVNGNWRMTFSFAGEDAVLTDYLDFH